MALAGDFGAQLRGISLERRWGQCLDGRCAPFLGGLGDERFVALRLHPFRSRQRRVRQQERPMIDKCVPVAKLAGHRSPVPKGIIKAVHGSIKLIDRIIEELD